MKKRNVSYILLGENNAILATGNCSARKGEWEMQDICDHADINMSDVWVTNTTET